MRRQTVEPLRVQPDLARGDREPAADQVEQRGLAGAVRTDQRVPLAGGDVQADAADDLGLAEVLGDTSASESARAGSPRCHPVAAISIRPSQTRLNRRDLTRQPVAAAEQAEQR